MSLIDFAFTLPTVRAKPLQSTRLLRPWDSPGNNTGVGCHFLLRGPTINLILNEHSHVRSWTVGNFQVPSQKPSRVNNFLVLSFSLRPRVNTPSYTYCIYNNCNHFWLPFPQTLGLLDTQLFIYTYPPWLLTLENRHSFQMLADFTSVQVY